MKQYYKYVLLGMIIGIVVLGSIFGYSKYKKAHSQAKLSCDNPQIKGNISYRTGEKIYHVPGGRFYNLTQISPSIGEHMFCTDQEAEAAGFRKSAK